jgi:integrase
MASCPLPLIDRPREPRRRWRILIPAEVVAIEHALDELAAEAETDRDRADTLLVKALFVTFMGTAIRWGEALGLHWGSVFLADPDGAYLKVERTWVRDADDTPKSQAGHRTIALGRKVSEALFEHRGRTVFSGDGERVFANPRTGNPFDADRYKTIIVKAFARAQVAAPERLAHDLRHSSITNAAAAGTKPEALMSRAGHSSYATTRRYIDLAGEQFREEADRLEERLWGDRGTKLGYDNAPASPEKATEQAANPHS